MCSSDLADAYAGSPLASAANDAALVADTLRAAGFDVTGARNLDQDTLRSSFREFLARVGAAGSTPVVALYMNGYGLQFEGENYFVPVGARIQQAADVPLNAVRLSDLTRPLASLPASVRLEIFDLAHEGA